MGQLHRKREDVRHTGQNKKTEVAHLDETRRKG
jgi:hypothetical protein